MFIVVVRGASCSLHSHAHVMAVVMLANEKLKLCSVAVHHAFLSPSSSDRRASRPSRSQMAQNWMDPEPEVLAQIVLDMHVPSQEWCRRGWRTATSSTRVPLLPPFCGA